MIMKKIGIDCRMIDESGIGRYISNLLLEISIINTVDEFYLFAFNTENEKLQKLPSNFKIISAPYKWHSFGEQFQFLNLINSFKLDLFHSPHPNMPYFYNRDFVITIHDLTMLKERTGRASTFIFPIYFMKWLVFKIMLSFAISKSKKIITVSEFVKKDIENHFPNSKGKIEVIYNGVSSKIHRVYEIAGIKKVMDRFNISKKFLFYVGNAYPHKNLERLILAFKLFNTSGNYQLILGGKNDFFYQRLKNEYANLDDIVFTGELTDYEISCFYSGCQAFIYPSMSEGFGIQIIEAIKCSARILCSGNSSFPEIAGDYAFYFNPFSVEDIRYCIEKNINSNFEYKKTLSDEILKKFSWKISAQKHNEIYQKS